MRHLDNRQIEKTQRMERIKTKKDNTVIKFKQLVSSC